MKWKSGSIRQHIRGEMQRSGRAGYGQVIKPNIAVVAARMIEYVDAR